MAGLAVAAGLAAGPAHAHPHVVADMLSDVVFDDTGRIVAINVEWTFDNAYSELAVDGLDTDKDGLYSASELEPLVRENIAALKEYDYFVYAAVDGRKPAFGEVTEYGQILGDDNRLRMHFAVPLAEPVDPRAARFEYRIYDPDFYIAFDFLGDRPVEALGAIPAGCAVAVGAMAFDQQVEETRQMLADKPPDWQPEAPTDFGSLFSRPVSVDCATGG